MRFLLGACTLPILFGTSPSLANERAYSLSFQSGYEISGFRGNGFEHSDFTKISVEGSSHSYRHREVNRGLRIRNTEKGQHIFFEDSRFLGVRDASSVLVENGLIKSQLNCLSPGVGKKSCYVINQEVCEAILKESGISSFADLESSFLQCSRISSVYSRAIQRSHVKASIESAFQDHAEQISSETSILKKAGRVLLTPFFDSNSDLKSTVQQDSVRDHRLFGLINICRNYSVQNLWKRVSGLDPKFENQKKHSSAR